MEIRDVLHGSVRIEPHEYGILDSRYFQRLRQIKQLGFAEFSYPSATHNRYVHSLGAMRVVTQAFETIFGRTQRPSPDRAPFRAETYERFRALARLGALLHDVGHGPLSHTTEFAMPEVAKLKLPLEIADTSRQANHEDYTLKIILDSSLTPAIEAAGKKFGFTPRHVAALIDPTITIADDFFYDTVDGEKIYYRPILQQLISSELDADRMDYLQRDSFYAGVSYGQFDYSWLVGNLTTHVHKGKAYLALEHRALYAFEDFLISRYHMFLMVYFHYKSVVFDEMLGQYFVSAPGEYTLPSDIEKYVDCNDAHLYSRLAQSKDPWAVRITEKLPYRMLIELHSGIPAGKTSRDQQDQLLGRVKADLTSQGIDYLEAKATSELSKYFRKPGDPIYVRYDNHYSAPSHIPLERCTDLFERYQEKRSITRLYVSPENYAKCRNDGRSEPLRYDEERV